MRLATGMIIGKRKGRKQAFTEIKDYLASELKNKPWNPEALAVLKDLYNKITACIEGEE
jgi:hypothetical protein